MTAVGSLVEDKLVEDNRVVDSLVEDKPVEDSPVAAVGSLVAVVKDRNLDRRVLWKSQQKLRLLLQKLKQQ